MNKRIEDLQYITRDSDQYTHAEQAKLMFENGVKWVQIRMKNSSDSEILAQSEEALSYAIKNNGTLIINDSIEVAKRINAHGVHLGLTDTPVNEARNYLGDDFIIGGTANTLNDILMQVLRGADYIGFGPFRFTTTKKKLSPVIGLNGYSQRCKALKDLQIDIPIIAVGGVTTEEIQAIKESGLFGVAISEALLQPWLIKESGKV